MCPVIPNRRLCPDTMYGGPRGMREHECVLVLGVGCGGATVFCVMGQCPGVTCEGFYVLFVRLVCRCVMCEGGVSRVLFVRCSCVV